MSFFRFLLVVSCLLTTTSFISAQQWGPGGDPGSAVTFYYHPKFTGDKLSFTSTPQGGYVGGKFEDDISSITVPKGMKVTVYERRNQSGSQATLYPGNYPYIMWFNDKISSIKIEPHDDNLPIAVFYEHDNIESRVQGFQTFAPGDYLQNQLLCNDCFTTAVIPPHLRVYTFKDYDYTTPLNANNPLVSRKSEPVVFNLHHVDMNDNISGIKVKSTQFGLDHVAFKNEVVKSVGESKVLAASSWFDNREGVGMANHSFTAVDRYDVSISRSVSNNKTIGSSTTVTTTLGVSAGPVSASVALALQKSLQKSKTITNSSSASYGQEMRMTQSTDVPKGCKARLVVRATPMVKTYDIVETYRELDINGKVIPNGRTETVNGTATVRAPYDVQAAVEQGECNGRSTGTLTPSVSTPPVTTPPGNSTASDGDTSSDAGSEELGEDSGNSTAETFTECKVYDDEGFLCILEWDEEQQLWLETDGEGDLVGEYRVTGQQGRSIDLREIDNGDRLRLSLDEGEVLLYDAEDGEYYYYGYIR